MDPQLLIDLGLSVAESNGVLEAEVPIDPVLWNPVSKKPIPSARFQVVGERLIAIDPPELVGINPISVAHLSQSSKVDDLVVKAFNDHCAHVVRRSAELASLGIPSRVDPATLTLTSMIVHGPMSFLIGTDRNGVFRVVRAAKDGVDFTVPGSQVFELNEFKEKSALESYLGAMFEHHLMDGSSGPHALLGTPLDEAPAAAVTESELASAEAALDGALEGEVLAELDPPPPAAPAIPQLTAAIDPGSVPAAANGSNGASAAHANLGHAEAGPAIAFPKLEGAIAFNDLARAFDGAELPPRSSFEVLAEIEVDGQQYRFAAARVIGRTFRGLLAGPSGKLWSQRFELNDFPGLKPLVAQVLQVDPERIVLRSEASTPTESDLAASSPTLNGSENRGSEPEGSAS